MKASSFRSPCCFHLAPYKVLMENPPRPMTEEYTSETKAIFDRYGTRVAILGCYINPVHPDENALEVEPGKFENGIDVAKALGNPIVAPETGCGRGRPFPMEGSLRTIRKYGLMDVPMTMENYRVETLAESIRHIEEAARA